MDSLHLAFEFVIGLLKDPACATATAIAALGFTIWAYFASASRKKRHPSRRKKPAS